MDKKYNTLLAGIMCIALSACGTTDRSSVVGANEINSGELYGESAGGIGLVTGPAIAGSRPAGSAAMSGTSRSSGTSGSTEMSGTSGASRSPEMSGATEMSGASGTSDAYGSQGAAASATAPGTATGGTDMSQSGMTSYGVIQSIDAMPREQAFGTAGAATMGGMSGQSGGSGAMTGGGAPGDMVYRLTLRMDDGSTRAVIQESRPGFQTGDRVRMPSSMLQRY